MIRDSFFLLNSAGVPLLVSLILSSLVPVLVSLLFPFFSQDSGFVWYDLPVPLGSG
jgi:hypothetical protein